MTNYYFVTTLLPSLQIGVVPEITFAELDIILRDNLSSRDYDSVKLIRSYYDVQNVRAIWKGDELDLTGNLNAKELEDALLQIEGIPKYIKKFLETYESQEQRLSHFPELIADYYREGIANSHGFVRQYLIFERRLRLILVALRARRLKRNLAQELSQESSDEEFIRQLLDGELPEEFEEVQTLFDTYNENPIDLYQALCQYRFDWIQNHMSSNPFSLERVLGFMLQLILVEKWQELDRSKGMMMMDGYVRDNK